MTLIQGQILFLCRDAVSVFSNPTGLYNEWEKDKKLWKVEVAIFVNAESVEDCFWSSVQQEREKKEEKKEKIE